MIDHPIAVRVTAARDIADDIRLLDLAGEHGGLLPAFAAGAHIDVALPDGMVRQYSLLNAPDERARYSIAVARDPAGRGGSIHLHDIVGLGDSLEIGAPRCHFGLIEQAPHSVFVAGGIGITPIWCMIQRLAALGASWEVHYAARTRAHAALLPEIAAITTRRGTLHTYFNLEGDPLMDLPAIVAAAPPATQFYACGPGGLLDAFRAACTALPPGQVHLEQFTAAEPAALGGGYVVELAKAKRTIAVAPGQTILDALTAAGIRASYSCREGVCGSCETAVLSGTPDHRDAILTEKERAAGRTMMICCSGALSARLVLDL